MRYNIKNTAKDEFIGFLLNPFDKTTYFDNKLIQKYQKSHNIDKIICLKEAEGEYCVIGTVFYKSQTIILDLPELFDKDLVNSKHVTIIHKIREEIVQIAKDALEEFKMSKLDELRETKQFKSLRKDLHKDTFSHIVYNKLGTSCFPVLCKSSANNKISQFVNGLTIDELVDVQSGKMDLVYSFLNELIHTRNFMDMDILRPELIARAEAYVAKGRFSKRERILIDYLAKTKDSGAKRFTVQTISGQKASCHNVVDYMGNVFTLNNTTFDFQDIDNVTYKGKVIYKKNTI